MSKKKAQTPAISNNLDANSIKAMASTGGRRPNLNEIASVYTDYFAYFTGIYPNPDKVLLRNHEGERYE
ncbi:hypothetical protein MBAV_000933, partial [Candidatus Magnetobacterium bavaricum]